MARTELSFPRSELRKRIMRSIQGRVYVPDSPGQVEETSAFPRDLTRLTDIEVRQQMSQWQAQLGFANTLMAREEIDVMAHKESLRRYEMAKRANALEESEGKAKRKWESETDLVGDDYWEQLRDQLQFSEAMVVHLSRLRASFEGYYKACSRELSARLGERERDEGRGGDGA